jgi:hypothetical protein
MQQVGAPFWPPCLLRRGGAACVAIEKERGAWEVGRFRPGQAELVSKTKKQQRLHFFRGKKIATTSSERKLDALRSGVASQGSGQERSTL